MAVNRCWLNSPIRTHPSRSPLFKLTWQPMDLISAAIADFGFRRRCFCRLLWRPGADHNDDKSVTPAGFKVMRVDMKTGQIHDFAVNKRTGPASKLFHGGFERPSHCQFGPDGNLYIVDFGIIHIAPERGAIRQQMDTGTLWRIRRTSGTAGTDST